MTHRRLLDRWGLGEADGGDVMTSYSGARLCFLYATYCISWSAFIKLFNERATYLDSFTLDESYTWPVARRMAIERAHMQCEVCGRSNHLQVHHIIPRHLGGTDVQDN